MAVDAALFGFAGVIAGTIATSLVTIYKEVVTTRREVEQRDREYERERAMARDIFRRENVLALQVAIVDLVTAAYAELDRMLAEAAGSSSWPTRQWSTPTAVGWSEAILRLELSRARVFDEGLRTLADEIRVAAGDSIWAISSDAARTASEPIEKLNQRFNERVSTLLLGLY